MPDPDFEKLRHHLLIGGVSPRVASRTIDELCDHYHDLKLDLIEQSVPEQEAALIAARQLGELDLIATHVTSRAELHRWSYRYPVIGRIALPILCIAAIPLMPIIAGANHAHALARWCMILTLSAVITAGLFLAMQISISPG